MQKSTGSPRLLELTVSVLIFRKSMEEVILSGYKCQVMLKIQNPGVKHKSSRVVCYDILCSLYNFFKHFLNTKKKWDCHL